MLRKKNGDIEWLEFELLADEPHIAHGVFLRHGGVSQGPYSSLNVLKGKGDDDVHVAHNRSRIMQCMELQHLITCDQVHGTHVVHVEELQHEFPDSDGLVTQVKNWGLVAAHADCQAALFYDPVRKAIATAHAGWRGQVHNIYQKVIEKMYALFGSSPQDLLVCISPSLGPEHSEFIHYKTEFPQPFWQFQVKENYFDLWAIAEWQLKSCGILSHHIEIAGMDTYANEADCFSYRREKARGREEKITGGHATVIGLRSNI